MAPAVRIADATHRRDSREASNEVSQVNDVIIPTSALSRQVSAESVLLACGQPLRFPRHRGFHILEIDVRAIAR